MWVGNTYHAARKPIARLTTDNIKYISDSKNNVVINILNEVEILRNIAAGKSNHIDNLYCLLKHIKDKFMEDQENFGKMIDVAVNEMLKSNVRLYTICIKRGGEVIDLAKTEGYRSLLTRILTIPDPSKLREGRCHVCGFQKRVLVDPSFKSGTLLKVYVHDKKGFASGIADYDENWLKNYAICIDCRRHITWSWSYIENNFVVPIGGINSYLIPWVRAAVSVHKLDKVKGYLKDAYGAVLSFEGLKTFEVNFDSYVKEDVNKDWYSLTLVFGAPGKADFNINAVIEDVPINRFLMLKEEMEKIEDFASKVFGGDSREWSIGFKDIYDIFPISVGKGKPKGYGPFLELMDSMLTQKIYPKALLIERAVQLARLHRYGVYDGLNIQKVNENRRDKEMCVSLIKYNLITLLLTVIGVIKMEERKLSISSDLNKCITSDLKEWFERMTFNELQQALFVLGYLVGVIGSVQYKKGDKKKSVLDKIDFQGMGMEKVMQLSVEVLNSLRIYELLSYNEILYHYMKALLDKNLNGLRKQPLENVYYILSGYSYNTCKRLFSEGNSYE